MFCTGEEVDCPASAGTRILKDTRDARDLTKQTDVRGTVPSRWTVGQTYTYGREGTWSNQELPVTDPAGFTKPVFTDTDVPFLSPPLLSSFIYS